MATVSLLRGILKQCSGFDKELQKLVIISAGDGNCEAELTVDESHSNIFGRMHGGCGATIVDLISTGGLVTVKNMDSTPFLSNPNVTVTMNINYMKDAKVGDVITIYGRTIRVAKTLAFLEVEILNKATGEVLLQGSHIKAFPTMK